MTATASKMDTVSTTFDYSPDPGKRYYGGLQAEMTRNVIETMQDVQNFPAISTNMRALERAEYVSTRTHGTQPGVQAWVGKEQTLLAQNVSAALGSSNTEAGAVLEGLEQKAQTQAAPQIARPGLFPHF